MNYDALKDIMLKSGNKILIIAMITLSLGAVMAIGAVSSEKTAVWVFSGIFLSLGGLMLFISLKNRMQVKSETHPLLKAIKNNDPDFVVWMYDKRIKSKVEGINVAETSNLVVVDKQGKLIEIVLGKNKNIDPLIDYLVTQFPNASVGYDDDTRAKISQLLGQKF